MREQRQAGRREREGKIDCGESEGEGEGERGSGRRVNRDSNGGIKRCSGRENELGERWEELERERSGGGRRVVGDPHRAADRCGAPGVKGRAGRPCAGLQSGSYLPLITHTQIERTSRQC